MRRQSALVGVGAAVVAGIRTAVKNAPSVDAPDVDMEAIEYAIRNNEPLEQSARNSWDVELGGVTILSWYVEKSVTYDPLEQAE